MARPKYVQTKATSLKVGISASETAEIILKDLEDVYGNEPAITDYGSVIYLTFNPGGENEEVILCTGFTRNSDGSVTINTGIVRGVAVISPYTTGGTARAHAAGTVVVVGNTPHTYERILAYLDEIALASAVPGSLTAVGYYEKASASEIDNDTDEGSVGPLAVTPDQLALSKYGLRLPTSVGKTYLDSVTGMLVPYAGATSPTGFLLCDGSTYNIADYEDLALVVAGYYGYGTGTTFTTDHTTDTITANSHGLSDGDIIFLSATTSLPTGLSANTPYYVRDATTNTFKLAATSGGGAIDFTSNGSGTLSFYTSFKVPDMRGSTPIGSGQKVLTFTFLDANVNTGTDVITVDSNDFLYTGQEVVLSNSGGALPTGLSATTYYVIRVTATTIKLATSRENADDDVGVDITAAAGGGTHTLTLTMTSRTHGQAGGEESHTIQTEELASHSHSVERDNSASGTGMAGGEDGVFTNGFIGATGGDTPHNNMPPYVVVRWLIKT